MRAPITIRTRIIENFGRALELPPLGEPVGYFFYLSQPMTGRELFSMFSLVNLAGGITNALVLFPIAQALVLYDGLVIPIASQYGIAVGPVLCLNKKNRTSTNRKNLGHDNSTPPPASLS